MIADRELDQSLEQGQETMDTKPAHRHVLGTHMSSPDARPLATPPLVSSTVLIGLAVVGLALWALRALEREREDRIDVEEARAALAEAEIAGTIPWELIKREHGL